MQKFTHSRSSQQKTTPVTKKSTVNRLRWLWLLLGLTGVATLSATAGALLAVSLSSTPLLQSQLSPEDAEVFGQGEEIATGRTFRLPELTRPVNILMLGIKVLSSDVRDPAPELADLGYHALVNSFEGLSDTMLLLRFNPRSKQLVVLSIPRDTRTWVEGAGVTKINSANYYGGPALSAKAISELLGDVAIDRYIRINVQGVEKLIDALGGVTVNVPQDMKYSDDSQHLYINLKAGKQRLNGDQAMQFLRFRYDENGDVGRVQRQQMLMRAVLEQTLNPATMARLPKILSLIQSHIDTNLSVEELLALVGFAAQTKRSNAQMLLLPGDFSEPGEYDLSYWLPSHRRIDELMDQYFGFGAGRYRDWVEPADLSVAIQDSTGDEAAIDTFLNTLYDGGYNRTYVGKSWNEVLPETRIVAQNGDLDSAQAIRRHLGFGEVRVESTGSLSSDITIQIGRDWLSQMGPAKAQ
ncbi:MAG: LCP family protein [Cyanothece sp. SIO1E1]|nr:LCP family protein [Cyanothece sp. SIO1E1]